MKTLVFENNDVRLDMCFDVQALCDIEESIGSIDALDQLMSQRANISQSVPLIVACAMAGSRHTDEKPKNKTEVEKTIKSLSIHDCIECGNLAKQAVLNSLKMEMPADNDADVDVVAKELEKKTTNK